MERNWLCVQSSSHPVECVYLSIFLSSLYPCWAQTRNVSHYISWQKGNCDSCQPILVWLKFRNTTSLTVCLSLCPTHLQSPVASTPIHCKSISKAFTYSSFHSSIGTANDDDDDDNVYILNMQKQSITELIEFLAVSTQADSTTHNRPDCLCVSNITWRWLFIYVHHPHPPHWSTFSTSPN